MTSDGGLKSFQMRLYAIPKAVRDAVKPALVKGGEEIARRAKTNARPSKDTGALIDSITVTPPGGTTPAYSQPGGSKVVPENQATVTVGNTDVRYGHLVEYGTTRSQAQPFFWPAVRSVGKRAQNRVKRAIRKAVREAK
jgi:HK97 gp10 family phage protein